MHSLIIGMTESGKTTLAKMLCRTLNNGGNKTAVLDPLFDDGWQCDFQTQNSDEFLRWAKSNRSAYLFVDEGSISIGRYNLPMQWLATMARHWGHSATFISQGLTQLPPAVRNNCSRLYLFTAADSVSKIAAEEFNKKELRDAEALGRGEFLIVPRYGDVRRAKIDFKKMTILSLTPQA